MKAVRFHEHGGLDALKYEDAPEPEIQPNEVLVKVKACALNHLDLWMRSGVRAWKLPMPHIVGSDISGEVVQVGTLVTKRPKRATACCWRRGSVAASARRAGRGSTAPAEATRFLA